MENIDLLTEQHLSQWDQVSQAARAFFTDMAIRDVSAPLIFLLGDQAAATGDDDRTVALLGQVGPQFECAALHAATFQFGCGLCAASIARSSLSTISIF